MTTQLARIIYRIGNPENDNHCFTDNSKSAADAIKNGYEVSKYILAAYEQEPVAYAKKGHVDRYLKGVNSGLWVYGSRTSDDDEPLFRHSKGELRTPPIAGKVAVYQTSTRPAWDEKHPWSQWEDCSAESYSEAMRFTHEPNGAGWIYQVRTLYESAQYISAEQQRVIEMLLSVCGAAFEMADDSCEQEVEGEMCTVVPSDAFQKLSDALDEIENSLPTEDADRPDVFLAWAAMPRAALKSLPHPAPSIPAAVTYEWRESLQELVKAMRDYEMDVGEPAPYKHRAMMNRAEALLDEAPEAAPQSHAAVPGGWIPVSERMPELDTRVLLYFSDYSGHIEDGFIGDEGNGPYHYLFDGDSLSEEPTHWMPLPAAPKE